MITVRTARSWRWAAPVVVAVGIGAGLGINGALSAGASPALPVKTPSQLLVALDKAQPHGLSGTVVQHSDLGIPALPDTMGADGTSLSSLLADSHTMRVWYAGADRQRMALLGNLGETDVIRNGRSMWLWNSDKNTAEHLTLPAHRAGKESPAPQQPLTPQQATDKLLAAVNPTTRVTVDATTTVAGRSAYQLVVRPRDTRSKVSSIRIAVDSATYTPLRLQIYASGKADPAAEIGFTHVSFATPGAEQFRFNPPGGAKVTEGRIGGAHTQSPAAEPTVVGTGWTQVLVVRGVDAADLSKGSGELGAVMSKLPRVSGGWGSGHLFTSSLVNALLTDDGRLIVGAVSPDQLYAAAAHR